MKEIPFAMAHPAIYETVERILAPMPRGRLLDVPAGRGALADSLIKMGFEVSRLTPVLMVRCPAEPGLEPRATGRDALLSGLDAFRPAPTPGASTRAP